MKRIGTYGDKGVKRMKRLLLNLLFPPHCPGCGASVPDEGAWCAPCIERYACPILVKHEGRHPERVWSAAVYAGGMKHVLQDIKFNGKKERGPGLAPFLQSFRHVIDEAARAGASTGNPRIVVVPIPVGAKKRKERGYNQVDYIFGDWARASGYVRADVLVKRDDTVKMWSLTKNERRENLQCAFSVKENASSILTKRDSVLLVDDIYTTGATMTAAAEVLRTYGVGRIFGLTVAGGSGTRLDIERR